MKITADTNLLVRMATQDDQSQARVAFDIVSSADEVMVTLPCIVEFVWVLESVYSFTRDQVAVALHTLMRMGNVGAEALAIDAGMKVHAAGGDFADGVIAAAGVSMGADTFVSFDRKAVGRVKAIGMSAELASAKP